MTMAKEPTLDPPWCNTISLGKLGVVALLCCFGYVIYNANEKLQSGTIGTAFKTVREKNVQGSMVQITRSLPINLVLSSLINTLLGLLVHFKFSVPTIDRVHLPG